MILKDKFLFKLNKFKYIKSLIISAKNNVLIFCLDILPTNTSWRTLFKKTSYKGFKINNSLLRMMISKNSLYYNEWSNIFKGNLLLIYSFQNNPFIWDFIYFIEKNHSLLILGGFLNNIFVSRKVLFSLQKKFINKKTDLKKEYLFELMFFLKNNLINVNRLLINPIINLKNILIYKKTTY